MGLYQQVSKRGSLDRTGQHRQPLGICGKLVQQPAASTASDNVQNINLEAESSGQLVDNVGIGEGKTFQDAASQFARRSRNSLCGLLAKFPNFFDHPSRLKELILVRVEDRGKRRRFL